MDKKISQLTAATTPLTGAEELAIVQSGSTVKATAQDVADLAGAPYQVYIAFLESDLPGTTITQTTLENTLLSGPISFSAPDAFDNIFLTLPGAPSATQNKVYLNLITSENPNQFNFGLTNSMTGLSGGLYISNSTSNWTKLKGTIEVRVYP